MGHDVVVFGYGNFGPDGDYANIPTPRRAFDHRPVTGLSRFSGALGSVFRPIPLLGIMPSAYVPSGDIRRIVSSRISPRSSAVLNSAAISLAVRRPLGRSQR